MIEYEAKVLAVEPAAVAERILELGGARAGARLQRRYVYDITPGDPTRWLRLRDTGTAVTLTVKQIHHDGIDGTAETEVSVGDFEITHELLRQLGHTPKAYQENHRSSFTLNDAELEIDRWPGLPPYLEIERTSRAHVLEVAALLGYQDLTTANTTELYARQGIDLNSVPDLRFPEGQSSDGVSSRVS
ncbi:class IV adenylate cyclase [Kribbella sp. NPDC051137]|uniref:class IV adenylate cyclase n=1 Tax=Kribbella sp. NPDC051137 TaxID=3155045 RepID=UPI002F4369CA